MDKARLEHIPNAPGVYIFKDKRDNIIYIGKARSLKKRVRSYFTQPQSFKIQIMTSKIDEVNYIVTETEAQARLKEAKLIKENLPLYNTIFRDDKSFPLICISNEAFPVVWIARRRSRKLKGLVSGYFGPYTNAGLLREALKSIRYIFGFRSCFKMPKKPCLYYRLKLCPAPCIGKISIKGYRQIIKNIVLFLEGRQEELINRLSFKMHSLANQKKFEEAAQVRNQVQTLSSISQEGMSSLSDSYPERSDFSRDTSGCRRGTSPERNDFFGDASGCRSQTSKRNYIRQKNNDIRHRESVELKAVLGLNIRPQRIEAFDVSNIFGSSACASMVSFYRGIPDKGNYRHFRIKAVSGINDYQMLQEAVGRRYSRLIDERLLLPDLIIIDGGKGQLNVVKHKLKELGLVIPVVSIAKPSKNLKRLREERKEEIYILAQKKAIKFKPNSPALHLIQRVRDEAHRFALSYHHILRRKKLIGK